MRRFPSLRFGPVLRLVIALLAVLGAVAGAGAPVRAASVTRYVATTGSDSGDCSTLSSPCQTIHYAVRQAAATDTIKVAAGAYDDNVVIPSQLTALTIEGAATATTIVDGANNGTVFAVNSGAGLTLTHLTIQHGSALDGGGVFNGGGSVTLTGVNLVHNSATTTGAGGGGGIYNENGSVTLTDVSLSGNSAKFGGGIDNDFGGTLIGAGVSISGNTATSSGGGAGGGINNENMATLTKVSISGNNAESSGGGIENVGSLTLTNVTLSGNYAGATGGGIDNEHTATLTNVTLSGNSTSIFGGGIYTSSTASLTNVTLSGNAGSYGGGGIFLNAGSLTLQASIIAGSRSGGDCANVAPTSKGANVVSDSSCSIQGTGDLTNTDPLLGALADNNGPSVGAPGATAVLQTDALTAGSPAIDRFPTAACKAAFTALAVPLTDERGVSRPQGSACDSGAYEAPDTTPPAISLTFAAPGVSGWYTAAPVTGSLTATDPSGVASITCTDNGNPLTLSSLSGIGSTSASGTLSVSGDGSHSLSCTAADSAGNSGAAPGSTNTATIKLDTSPPSITLTTPADGAVYAQGQSVIAAYTCSDATSGVASCAGPVANGAAIATSADGSTSFTVKGCDIAGNCTQSSVHYLVDTPPVASAGGPYTGTVGQPAQLNGSASDSDGAGIASYHWSASTTTATGVCSFADPTAAATSVTCTAVGGYSLTLSATDGAGLTSQSAAVKLTVFALGDVNGDGAVTGLDALCVLRLVASLPGTAACPVPPPGSPLIAQTNPAETTPSALDALCILRGVAGLAATTDCPALAAAAPQSAGAPRGASALDPRAATPQPAEAPRTAAAACPPSGCEQASGGKSSPGEAAISLSATEISATPHAQVPVVVTATVSGAELGAWTVELRYDPSAVRVTSCSAAVGSVCNPTYAAGVIRIAGASAAGVSGRQTLAQIAFEGTGRGHQQSSLTLAGATLTDANGDSLQLR